VALERKQVKRSSKRDFLIQVGAFRFTEWLCEIADHKPCLVPIDCYHALIQALRAERLGPQSEKFRELRLEFLLDRYHPRVRVKHLSLHSLHNDREFSKALRTAVSLDCAVQAVHRFPLLFGRRWFNNFGPGTCGARQRLDRRRGRLVAADGDEQKDRAESDRSEGKKGYDEPTGATRHGLLLG